MGRTGDFALPSASLPRLKALLLLFGLASATASCIANTPPTGREPQGGSTVSDAGVDATSPSGQTEQTASTASGANAAESAPGGQPPQSASSNSNTEAAASPPLAASAMARPSCPGLGTWNAEAAQFEAEVLLLVNQARARGARCGGEVFAATSPLKANKALDCVARAYAKTMYDGDFFDHTGEDGSSPTERMEKGGLDWQSTGENIAFGQDTPQEVMDAWMTSPGHCSNIMDDFGLIGIGYYKGYWVQDFILPD